ncbi:MAG: HAD hydrolase family protein [bacterium]|nr:HAD hydrolase family protein [bacterium]
MDPTRPLLIALDMDGTLVDTEVDDTLAAREIEALEAARSAGHVVAVCTGRNLPSLTNLLERSDWFPDDLPMVLLNGAVIWAGLPRRELLRRELDGETVREIIGYLRHFDTVPMVYGTDEDDGILHYEDRPLNPIQQRYLDVRRSTVGRLQAVPDLLALDWRRAMEVGTIDELVKVRPLCEALATEMAGRVKVIDTLSLLGDGAYGWAEVFHPEAGKGHALRELAAHCGIPLAQTVAVGDNFNDLDMFEVAALSVAMGNSPADVKGQADHVTGAVQTGGAAAVLTAMAAGEIPALRKDVQP